MIGDQANKGKKNRRPKIQKRQPTSNQTNEEKLLT